MQMWRRIKKVWRSSYSTDMLEVNFMCDIKKINKDFKNRNIALLLVLN